MSDYEDDFCVSELTMDENGAASDLRRKVKELESLLEEERQAHARLQSMLSGGGVSARGARGRNGQDSDAAALTTCREVRLQVPIILTTHLLWEHNVDSHRTVRCVCVLCACVCL